jgi:hypothetical protein
MASRNLERTEWEAYFDHLSKTLIGERAEVKVTGLTSGDRIEARWLPLIGITYDRKGDLLEIAMEGLDHLVRRPRSIVITEGSVGLESMEIVDSERRKQNVRLMKPLRFTRRAVAS